MKVYRFLVLSVILLAFLLSWFGISDVEASNLSPRLRGELCWEFTDQQGTQGIAKFRVLPIGGGHHIVSGKTTAYDGELNIVYGNAEIEGNTVLMTLIGSGKEKDSTAMWTWIGHVVLDRSTLNGTYESIGNDRNYSDQPIVIGDIFIDSDTEYDTGSLTFIPCPR
jgi:hypothetical protein